MPTQHEMRCPKCGKEGPFKIFAFCTAVLGETGVEHAYDFDWSEDAHAQCDHCDEETTVGILKSTHDNHHEKASHEPS